MFTYGLIFLGASFFVCGGYLTITNFNESRKTKSYAGLLETTKENL